MPIRTQVAALHFKRICCALAVGTAAALAIPAIADADVLVNAIRPSDVACGTAVMPGVWYQSFSGGPRWAHMTIRTGGGKVAWRKNATATTTWRFWRFRGACGTSYTLTYRVPGGTVRFPFRVKRPVKPAPINDCHYGVGGAYHNLTTRVVTCSAAEGFHGLAFRMLNYVTTRFPPVGRDGSVRWGEWTIRMHWYHDPAYPHIGGGNYQLDVRATASRGRVVRFQTAWD